MVDQKKEAAVDMAAIKEDVENGKITINQARIQMGLSPIDSPETDRKMKTKIKTTADAVVRPDFWDVLTNST